MQHYFRKPVTIGGWRFIGWIKADRASDNPVLFGVNLIDDCGREFDRAMVQANCR